MKSYYSCSKMLSQWLRYEFLTQTDKRLNLFGSAYCIAALVDPEAALLLLGISGVECKDVFPCTKPVIIAQHAHYQVQRVAV